MSMVSYCLFKDIPFHWFSKKDVISRPKVASKISKKRFVQKIENQSREIKSLYLFVFERDILDFTPWKSDFRCKPVILFINIETTSINTKPQICISLILKCQNAKSVSRFKFFDYTFIHVVEYTLISDMVLITGNSKCLRGAIKYVTTVHDTGQNK